ncbi:KpsF/GutQ family sugar-phosphate isomerase [Terriglobus roseus]|uniref:Arabinose-5-phosphate isomerase n=1 Tax=Terriglobus roseus TaxID=392734 RepID=A0A1H4KYH8_9BACT|nr:KpsF/GutQ family sugar-phosphate isomerase [Terriglobus roseus]SEB63012.1 arabinose-5-phosphate isomerase [Terriglobus roseus]
MSNEARQSAADTIACEIRGLEALRNAFGGPLGAAFERAVEALTNAPGRVIVTGVGKSGHIARKIAATLASTGKPAHFVHPSDASHGDLGMVRPDDVVMALSWSGETAELSDIVAYTRRFGVTLIASTGSAESTLARAADIVLAMPSCDEACSDLLAPTTSTTMQLALGDALAVALLDRGSFSAEDFRTLHPGGRLGARLLRVSALMHTGDELPLVTEDASLQEAIVRMTGGRFGMTGVVNTDGTLVGVITDGDLRRAFTRGFQDRPATEVMGRSPRTIAPDELAQAALARMNAEGITSLFVLDHGRVTGVLHVHDLLRAGLV